VKPWKESIGLSYGMKIFLKYNTKNIDSKRKKITNYTSLKSQSAFHNTLVQKWADWENIHNTFIWPKIFFFLVEHLKNSYKSTISVWTSLIKIENVNRLCKWRYTNGPKHIKNHPKSFIHWGNRNEEIPLCIINMAKI
jgi:hypothetical protein